ncbi:MAG TPA: hypothetical protein PKZ52_10955 [Cellvibrionaceae bacterium]|nr:hypothetical protein [Cellvibrionaceae bacterium]
MENAQQQSQINAIRVRDLNDERVAKMNKALAWSMHSLKDAPEEYRSFVATHPNLDAGRILSPEYGQAIETLKGAAEGRVDYRSPEVAAAFDVLNPEIGLGATQGRKVSTSRLYPGRTPGTLMVGLKVDGDPEERPLTERRSSDPDDPVKEVKLEDLFGRLKVAEQYRGFLSDPENQKWFIQQTIGEELKKSADQETIKNLQVKKLTKEINEGDPVTYRADGEGNLMQLPSRSGGAVATPVLDSKGNPVKAPQKSGAGASSKSSLEKEVEYLKTLGMTPDEALAYRKQRTGNDAKDTELMAMAISRQSQIPMEDYADDKNPEQKLPGAITQAINARQKIKALTQAKSDQPAPTPTGQPRKAPQAAIDELRKNPSLKDKFQEFYGYLPDGM